ncbi:MAG: hypothetical protein MZW92_36850 [Comamonadaceae bacterium]|nr:hypothetical protein [Comamonadaceae bacterium]
MPCQPRPCATLAQVRLRQRAGPVRRVRAGDRQARPTRPRCAASSGRFAERLQIQPSYWSQIKGRSRQIGERLARQFEQLLPQAARLDGPAARRRAPQRQRGACAHRPTPSRRSRRSRVPQRRRRALHRRPGADLLPAPPAARPHAAARPAGRGAAPPPRRRPRPRRPRAAPPPARRRPQLWRADARPAWRR